MSGNIAVAVSDTQLTVQGEQLAQQLGLPFVAQCSRDVALLLLLTPEHLSLVSVDDPQFKAIYVDFVQGKLWHRYRYGGGKRQLIARAVGLRPGYLPSVLDVTAGLGQDGFVLSSLGCDVTLLERSCVVAALLQDGFNRACQQDWFKQLKMTFLQCNAITYLKELDSRDRPEVIYLDPMFPERSKSALVKKEMRVLRQLVGDDCDAVELFNLALNSAKKRVVVKRPRLAPSLTAQVPGVVYQGKSSRFDVFLL